MSVYTQPLSQMLNYVQTALLRKRIAPDTFELRDHKRLHSPSSPPFGFSNHCLSKARALHRETSTLQFETRDGIKVYYSWKNPTEDDHAKANECRGTIVLVHGLAEHSGRYQHVINHLCEAGYQVFYYDQRGHGRTTGPRTFAPSHLDFVLDLLEFVDRIVKHRQLGPLVLYGHSFGGGVSLRTLLEKEHPFEAAIITSPLIEPANRVSNFLWSVGEVASILYPQYRFPLRLKGNQLSHVAQVGEDYDSDQLCEHTVTARLAREMLTHGLRLPKIADQLQVPTLLLHGDADTITSFEASQRFAENAGDICNFQAWNGMYHELHNEANHKEVLEALTTWLDDQQLKKSSSPSGEA